MSLSPGQQLRTQGFVVLRNAIPVDLLQRLRLASEPCAGLARAKFGANAQRLQPIAKHQGEIDLTPFHALRCLLSIIDDITDAFGQRANVFDPDTLGVLVEPNESSYLMVVHRDWLFGKPYLDVALFMKHFLSERCFFQINAALYEDPSLWVMPGSHRYVDLVMEAQRSAGTRYLPAEGNEESRQRMLRTYFGELERQGLIQVVLQPGDVAIYKATLLHAAEYSPARKRRTLHDFLDTDEFAQYRQRQFEAMAANGAMPPEWWNRKGGTAIGSVVHGSDWWSKDPAELAYMSVPPQQ